MSKSELPVLALGLPNLRRAQWRVDAAGKPSFSLPCLLPLPPETDRRLKGAAREYWFPVSPDAPPFAEKAAINMCADYDLYSDALYDMSRTARTDIRIFNHPDAMARCRIETMSAILGDIPGLIVPRTLRFKARHLRDFRKVFDETGFKYPVVLRNGTSISERDGVLILSADHWDRADRLGWWRNGWVTMTQLDTADLAQFQRLRVCIFGRKMQTLAYQFSYGSTTMASGLNMPEGPDQNNLMRILKTIGARIPLDFWTFDLTFKDNGRAQFEQLWVGLPPRVAQPGKKGQTMHALMWSQVGPQLDALLTDPDQWRGYVPPKPVLQ
ncbi:hypothetical protein [Marivivens marinus]|uniref:hypothetical protein n=1 Tax=Marivivens marinus TaxID=3110173 RepID=UPI003B848637